MHSQKNEDILKNGSILRIETVTGNIYYCHWRRGDKGLYQYRSGKWVPRKKDEEVIAKKAAEWYGVITSTMKEEFSVSGIDHLDFVTVLRKDTGVTAAT